MTDCGVRVRVTAILNGRTMFGGEDLICTMPMGHDPDHHGSGLTQWRIAPEGIPILKSGLWMAHAGYVMPRGVPKPGQRDVPDDPVEAHHHEREARKMFEFEYRKLCDRVENFAAEVRR